MEDLDKRVLECGLSPEGDMFVKVDDGTGSAWQCVFYEIGILDEYLTSEQIRKLRRYLSAISILNSEDASLAKPPSIGRGGTEAALQMKEEDLINLERLAKLKQTGRKFGL